MSALRDVTVVIPTIGRPSLATLLHSLAAQVDLPARIVVVDDREPPGPLPIPDELKPRAVVVRTRGRGPAAARNRGWQVARTPWVVFLDDDVVTSPTWSARLADDLGADDDVGAIQATITVPRPSGRPLTDSELNTVALEQAPWITADLAVRRDLLDRVAGFDERFPRAYREDSDFALRAQASGWRFAVGSRGTEHPLRAELWWSSVRRQRGNRDDALMRALHGRAWADVRGRRSRHIAITAAGLIAAVAGALHARRVATAAAVAWAAGTAELAVARIAAGSRTPREVAAMMATSLAIPPAAVWHWSLGRIRWRRGRTPPWSSDLSPGPSGRRVGCR